MVDPDAIKVVSTSPGVLVAGHNLVPTYIHGRINDLVETVRACATVLVTQIMPFTHCNLFPRLLRSSL